MLRLLAVPLVAIPTLLVGIGLAYACILVPLLAPVLLAGGTVAFLCFHSPKHGLILAIFFVPLERLVWLFPPSEKGQITLLSSQTVPKLIILVVLVMFVLRLLVNKNDGPVRTMFGSPLPFLAVLFILLVCLSAFNASSLAPVLLRISRIVNGFLLFLLIASLIEDRKSLHLTLKVLCLSYFIVGICGAYEAFTQTHVLEQLGYPMPEMPYTLLDEGFRVAGPAGDPDFFAISVVLGFIVTLAVWPLWRGRFSRIVLTGLLLLFAFNVLATGSRAAPLCLMGALGVFWVLARIPHKVLIATAAIAIGAGLMAAYTMSVSDLTADRYTGEAGMKSWVYRYGWARMSIEMMEDSPLIGVGAGNFMANRRVYFDPIVPREPYHAHNTFLQLGAEAGIPALLAYISLYGVSALMLFLSLGSSRNPVDRHIAVCLLSMLVAFFGFAATSNTIQMELVWTLFAFVVIVWKLTSVATNEVDAAPSSERPHQRSV